MNTMKSDAIKDNINDNNELARKYSQLKLGKFVKNFVIRENLDPLIKPVTDISSNFNKFLISENDEKISSSNKIDKSLSRIYRTFNHSYGLQTNNEGQYFIGSEPVELSEKNLTFVSSGEKYPITPGLLSLLTDAHPSNYTADDSNNYENIVVSSHLYKRNNDPTSKHIKSNRSYKYKKFIKPIISKHHLASDGNFKNDAIASNEEETEDFYDSFNDLMENTEEKSIYTGKKEGFGLKKIITNTPVEYVYWNTIDELLERLYILYGELKSGNNNPNIVNEIVNIIQEFKEI